MRHLLPVSSERGAEQPGGGEPRAGKPGRDRDSSRLMLGVGIEGLVLATALAQFVYVGLFGAVLLPVAFVMLSLGSWKACRDTRPRGRRLAGLALLALAFVGLGWAGLGTGDLVSQIIRQNAVASRPPPELENWLRVCAGGLLSALAASLGLRLGAVWSPRECLAWALAFLLVPGLPMALLFALAHLTST